MPRAGLNAAKVVEQAAELADEAGWDGLSLAGLASRCGVRLPSLYKHIASLDALRLEVSALGLRELTAALTSSVVGKSGSAALHAMADAYRTYALAHPGRYQATVSAPTGEHPGQDQAAVELFQLVKAALSAYGLSGDDAIDAVRALRATLHGFVHLETNHAFGLPTDVDRSYRRLVEGIDTAIAGWASNEQPSN
ncbi:TetR/AcrR family transcriptional regulator [Arthrobacter sp. M4]|uniref:TetR/AcrR family transcriptional regulator n=1 Tax=Arthrobacter sp. M4 TaxID=218160 RepID=UPI001CDB9B59|nr:TetR/AcrR family transcriptional regulator [Arthrobacter sp. M4]MCA4131761.1 WHG domain-containing protein [Arthrobacter sp. M4]